MRTVPLCYNVCRSEHTKLGQFIQNTKIIVYRVDEGTIRQLWVSLEVAVALITDLEDFNLSLSRSYFLMSNFVELIRIASNLFLFILSKLLGLGICSFLIAPTLNSKKCKSLISNAFLEQEQSSTWMKILHSVSSLSFYCHSVWVDSLSVPFILISIVSSSPS